MPIITLTTDFGPSGRYVAQMKGVLLTRCPGATLVDVSHEVPPQDIAAGARLLEAVASCYPPDTVHLAVVDPGVGTDRPIVAIEARGQRFIGPDNGLFGWLADDVERVVTVEAERLGVTDAWPTFHGRDLMAPAAALLAEGAALHGLGPKQEGLVHLPAEPAPVVSDGRIDGAIVEIDRYGNLITNIPNRLLEDAPHGDALRVACGEHETFGLQTTYADQPAQTLVALVGSEGFVELAIVNGNASDMLRARVGDSVVLGWGTTDRCE